MRLRSWTGHSWPSAIRLAVGVAVRLVSAAMWIVVIAALVAGGLWARSTLKSAKIRRRVKPQSSPECQARRDEDPVAVDTRDITEQLREQGRG